MDAVGNIPLYISLLKRVKPHRQRIVILREMVVALFIIIAFGMAGEKLMRVLNITQPTIQIAGGIILFILCLKMIFPGEKDSDASLSNTDEPFIVPLAVPLVAGPAVLAAVMIYWQREPNHWIMIGSIGIAWIFSLFILLSSSFLQKILGWRGIIAIERLMGLVLILIAIQMFLSGVGAFITTLHFQ